jgi:hypothetical protein
MAPKKTVKRIKRSLPPRNKDGFDPRLVALGAIGGAIGGRAATTRLARGNVSRRTASEANWYQNNMRAYASDPDKAMLKGAQSVQESEYERMPRVKNQGKVDLYESLRKTNDYTPAKKLSGLSDKDMNKLSAKKIAKTDLKYNDTTAKRMRSAARTRADNTRGRNTRRGAIGGAAFAALVQLVAKELNKK